MHHRFLKFLSTKKPKRPYADPNQSMIDVISDAGSFNDSFRSVQPSLGDTSFTDLNNPARQLTETSPYLADYPLNASSSRANISSVFNIPKKNSIIEDLYGILQEHVVDQLGEMIQQSKKHHSEVKLLERIQARDFDVYIARLKTAYEKYRKINASRLQKSKGAEKVNVHDTLLKCYQFVPSQYFEDDFFFNFEYLTQNKQKIFSTQEDLGDYLDNVEVNLYYQISDKFQAFLDVILKLNQMEVQIENSLYGIRYLRNFNHKLKNDCSNQIERTLRLKRRKINIEKTLGLIGLISVVKKTLPTLVQLIQRNNIESAVKLIKTSEDTYKNKLKQVKSLKNFNTSFNDARATLEKMLTSEFEDRCISYLTPTLSYNKTSHPNVSMEISMAEESFVNMSMSELINAHEDETPGSHQLYWTLTDCHTNTEAENNIVKIVLEYIKIKEFPLTTYKVKLVDKMKKFHQQFIRDMEEYISSVSAKDENPSTRNAPKFDLNIKFILFYFELYKRFITRQFKLNNKILSALVTHYNQNYTEKQDSENPQNLPVLDVKAMKYLNETVQEFYLAFSLVLKYFNDRITEIISMNNVEQMTVNQFAKLSAICQEILHYFDSELKLHQSVNSWITTNKESIKKPLMNLASSLSDKISIVPIRNLKIEYEKKFISSRYKHQYEELKDSLEQESWQPADIPYAFGVYFNLFFGVEPNKGSIADKRKMSDADDILRSSRPDAVEMASTHLNETESILTEEVPKPEELVAQNGKPTEEIYSIKKNEIFVHNMRFKTTSSFLKLVQVIYEDYHIALRFKSVGTEAISKILEIIKFYNSYCIQLILGAGATTFGKIKKITAKTLALSSVSLSLLLEMVDPFTQRVFENIPEINHEWLTVEVNKLKNDLNHHVNEITSKIRTILKSKLIEQCNELKRLNWANAQEKINIPTKSSASILHNTRQMYKTIEDYLSKELLIVIFNVVFKDIKENFLPIFQNLNVESKLAAKRIKEELKYFSEDLYQIPIYQAPELKYADFEDKVFLILEEKCNHYLEATLIN